MELSDSHYKICRYLPCGLGSVVCDVQKDRGFAVVCRAMQPREWVMWIS